MHSGYELQVTDQYRDLSFSRQVLFITSSRADVPLAFPRPGIPSSRVRKPHSTSTRSASPRAGAGSHPVPHRHDRAGGGRCHGLDRRPGRIGAPGRCGACSASAARHARLNRVAHYAHYLCVSHHDPSSFGNDDGSAHDDHDEARCQFRRVLAPLAGPRSSGFPPLGRWKSALRRIKLACTPLPWRQR